MSAVEFVQAEFDSDLYRQNLKLRADILRKPLGLELDDEDTGNDAREKHFSAVNGGRVVACVQLRTLDAKTLKLRQMAVLPSHRGQGVGAGLVRHAEAWARGAGYGVIMMHARGTATGFYEKLGYRTEGVPFDEQTMPHIQMRKSLATI